MSLSGARATWSNYTLDGITNTDVDFNLYIVLPSVDALQEFKVQSGIYPAEFGREAGQVNVSTKRRHQPVSRHGVRFLRNDTLDAKNYDFLRARTPRIPAEVAVPPEPVRLHAGRAGADSEAVQRQEPAVLHVELRGIQERGPRDVASATTMTPAMRNGDFSVVTTALQDPLTRSGYAAQRHVVAVPRKSDSVQPLRQELLLLMSKFVPLPNVAPATRTRCR